MHGRNGRGDGRLGGLDHRHLGVDGGHRGRTSAAAARQGHRGRGRVARSVGRHRNAGHGAVLVDHGDRRRSGSAAAREVHRGSRRVARAGGRHGHADRLSVVEAEVQVPVVGGIQDLEPIGLGRHRQGRVRRAVHDGCVHERFGGEGRIRRAGAHQRRAGRIPDRRARIRLRAGDERARVLNRPEPRAVVPSAERVRAHRVGRVLVRHVDVREPQIALSGRSGLVAARVVAEDGRPGRVGGRELCGRRNEGLVLDDQRHAPVIHAAQVGDDLLQRRVGSRDVGPVDQVVLHGVGHQVAGRFTGIDVQAGDAVGVVVVEHQPRALLVRPVEGERTISRRNHVGDVGGRCALLQRRALAGGRGPLVRRAVADPRGGAAVQVQRRAVLGVVGAVGARAGAHHRDIGRDEEIAAGADRETIGELDAHRPVGLRDDDRAEVMRRLRDDGVVRGRRIRHRGIGAHIRLHVTPEQGALRR